MTIHRLNWITGLTSTSKMNSSQTAGVCACATHDLLTSTSGLHASQRVMVTEWPRHGCLTRVVSIFAASFPGVDKNMPSTHCVRTHENSQKMTFSDISVYSTIPFCPCYKDRKLRYRTLQSFPDVSVVPRQKFILDISQRWNTLLQP